MTATATLDRTVSEQTAATLAALQEKAPKALQKQPGGKGLPDLAAKAKNAAAQFLERRGYDILNRDWRCEAGTIDIVCRPDDATLVFVEVLESEDGFPQEDIGPEKRQQLEAIAMSYLMQMDGDPEDVEIRFDTVCIVPVSAHRAFLRHHINCMGLI